MKFTASAVLAAASALSVSADTLFVVSNFSAFCIPHSTECSYSFGLLQPGTMQTIPTQCSIMEVSNSDGTLPAVTDGTCTNSARTWTIENESNGDLLFTASQAVSPITNQTGIYTIPASQLVIAQTGASRQQSYVGPETFDLTAVYA